MRAREGRGRRTFGVLRHGRRTARGMPDHEHRAWRVTSLNLSDVEVRAKTRCPDRPGAAPAPESCTVIPVEFVRRRDRAKAPPDSASDARDLRGGRPPRDRRYVSSALTGPAALRRRTAPEHRRPERPQCLMVAGCLRSAPRPVCRPAKSRPAQGRRRRVSGPVIFRSSMMPWSGPPSDDLCKRTAAGRPESEKCKVDSTKSQLYLSYVMPTGQFCDVRTVFCAAAKAPGIMKAVAGPRTEDFRAC